MSTNESRLPTLFISYAWSDGNDYADELYDQLKDDFRIVRDKLDLSIKEGLTKFMERINTTDFAIVVLTNKYLKSLNCMYEATFLAGQNDWVKRTLILIIDGEIYDVDKKIEVLKYWKEKYKVIQDFKNDDSYIDGLELDGRKLDTISENIGTFLQVITDSKNPSQIAIVKETINMKKSNSNLEAKAINTSIEEKILQYLQENPNSSRREIAECIGISRAYSVRLIQKLVERNLVTVRGSGKKTTFSVTKNN
ncbi:MAG: TIR domain-containing protein [Lachnospiraceae bacterium]